VAEHTPGRLYYHKTDGGAEYLCTKPVRGTTEGDLRFAAVRLDGTPELLGKLADVAENHQKLMDACILMRARLEFLANKNDQCWRDWGGAYEVDAAIAKAEKGE